MNSGCTPDESATPISMAVLRKNRGPARQEGPVGFGPALWHGDRMATVVWIALRLIEDVFQGVVLLLRSNESVQAENLFLRRRLALYIERGVHPRRIDATTRVSLALLAKLFDWRSALVVAQPATMIR
jgi:hypothetical protein